MRGLGFGILLLLTAAGSAAGAASERPHILLISVDTLRADRLSSYGYKRATRPRIDELLAAGARFTEARTVEPLTAPALASMLTSLDPHDHGSTRNGLPVRPDLLSFSKILARRGYATAAFLGNWTLKEKLSGLGEHFETYEVLLERKRWFGLARREATADDLVEESISWLDQHLDAEPVRPFLLWIHLVEPHAPYRLRREFLKQIGVKATATTFSPRRRYDSEIAYVDNRIGRFLDQVFSRLRREEVIVAFVADHGESLGEHGYWGHGRHLYEASLKIPMGLVWSGGIEPSDLDVPALITDLGPTLLGLVGLPYPDFFRGFDWSRVLRGEEEPPAGRITFHQAHRASVQPREDNRELRRKGLLEVGRIESARKEILRVNKGRQRLFDLGQDPEEKTDLADGASQASSELLEWLERVREGLVTADDLPPPSLSQEDLDALRALGYIE